jgi:pimeloyl-ACP methyl ester carboxylesterase
MNFSEFQHKKIKVNQIQLHYRIAGNGMPLVMLHGWPQHSLMWHSVAPQLAEHYTVILPDMRGVGGSDIPTNGYDKKTMAEDIYQLVQQLGFEKILLVGYDLGSGVAYSLAAMYPDLVEKIAVMEFGLPGFGYENIMQATEDWHAGSNWHLSFFTVPQVAEFAFQGKERELLAWFFWHLSHNESAVSPEHFENYVKQLQKPGALRAGIEYYANVWTDKRNNLELAQSKLPMPLLAIGGESSSREYVGMLFEPVASNITTDENPAELAQVLLDFFKN